MKVLLLNACGNTKKSFYIHILNAIGFWSSCTLEQLAAVTPKQHEVTIIKDLTDKKYKKIDFSTYDIIGISYYTATANLAYKIADKIRKNYEIPVILGGYHASVLSDEAKQHADSVVIGEGETIWPNILNEFEKKKKLKPFYYQSTPVSAEKIPCSIGDSNSIIPVYSIEATRGCINHCEFCAITNSPIGKKIRFKPVEKVLNAIENIPSNYFLFMDSALNLNRKYSKELFKGMKKMNKRFGCFFNANIADDEELLKLASEAGCTACTIGFETTSQSTIDYLDKTTNNVKKYRDAVKKLHDYGIGVVASLVFGFENDTANVFDSTYDQINEWDVDSIGANILTPLPGTPLFYRLEKENRILTKDWSKYDYYNVVFQPKNMTPEELYTGTKHFVKKFFRRRSILYRSLRNINYGWYPFLGITQHNIISRLFYNMAFT